MGYGCFFFFFGIFISPLSKSSVWHFLYGGGREEVCVCGVESSVVVFLLCRQSPRKSHWEEWEELGSVLNVGRKAFVLRKIFFSCFCFDKCVGVVSLPQVVLPQLCNLHFFYYCADPNIDDVAFEHNFVKFALGHT